MKSLVYLFLTNFLLVGFTGIALGFGKASATALSIRPNLIDASSFPEVPQRNFRKTKLSSSTRTVEETARRLAQEISIQIANDIAYGLVIAHDKRQIKYGTKMYRKVQTAINLLRRGAGLDGASRRSGVPRPVLDQLMKWGQQRPGASLYHVE